MIIKFKNDLKKEFTGYNAGKFTKDLMAGLTVTVVALPLALAFGVASGAGAAAGLITAILSSFIIGFFSGAEYQISGPTGSMTAILVSLCAKYSLQGVFLAGMMAGVILLIAGICKFGRVISIIPTPVIAGFTSGIAIIIALGQIDNFFGVKSVGNEPVEKIISYFEHGFHPNVFAVITGLLVIAIMISWPKKLAAFCPSSLLALIVVTAVSIIFDFDIARVGEIPATLIPVNRLEFSSIKLETIKSLVSPAIGIAALGMIESLLCGAAASRMKKGLTKFDGDRELVAQGLSNIILPFFGGIPAASAISRTSVAIKSGLVTRLTGIIHGVGLLLSMFLLGSVMSRIPLSALAGVLMVTAWRMNQWHTIKYIVNHKFVSAALKLVITMAATVLFDLTLAVIIGIAVSVILFVVRISSVEIEITDVDYIRLGINEKNMEMLNEVFTKDEIKVVYFTGPIFFTGVERLRAKFGDIRNRKFVFSMRGVPLIDTSGLALLTDICEEISENGGRILFCSTSKKVQDLLIRAEVVDNLNDESFYPDAKVAIKSLMREKIEG